MFKSQRAVLDTVDIFSNVLENVCFSRKMTVVTDILELSLIDLYGRLLYSFSITAEPITTNLATYHDDLFLISISLGQEARHSFAD